MNKFFKIAKKIAQKSTFSRSRHGAILVKGGSVISVSENKNQFNSFVNRFVQHNGHGTIHAELGCILGLDKNVTKNSKIYVARIDKHGKFKMSKPCKMCQECLKHVGIKSVHYTISHNEYGVLIL